MAYDITRRDSYESLPRWLEDVKRYAGSHIVQCLIGIVYVSEYHLCIEYKITMYMYNVPVNPLKLGGRLPQNLWKN